MAEDAPDAAQHAAVHALQQQQQAAVVTAASNIASAPSAAGAPRGPYRGKCLYKTGKCTNERALKTSGAAHNLCDEHRRRQNEHQRKLDSKNRCTRNDKRASLAGSERPFSGDGGEEGPTPSSPSGGGGKVAAGGGSSSARYSPYERNSSGGKTSSRSPHDASAESTATTPIKTFVPDAATQIAPVMMQAAGSMQALPVSQGPPPAATVTHATVPPVQIVQAPALPPVEATPKVYMSPAPQPPQMAYPYMMQDFDGIVVPLPSYLEGHERIDFRARIYQKVLDFISEECIRRFSGKMVSEGSLSQNQQQQQQQQQRMYGNGAPVAVPMGYYPPPQQQQQQYVQPVATHHYQSEAAPPQQQQQQVQQQHVVDDAHTPNKSVGAPTPDKEKRGSRAKQVEVEEGSESTDEEVEEQQPQPPAKKKTRRLSAKGSRSDA